MEKIYSVFTRRKCLKWLDTPQIKVFGHANSNGTGFEVVYSDVSELWAVCMHYLGNCSTQHYFWDILQHYSKDYT